MRARRKMKESVHARRLVILSRTGTGGEGAKIGGMPQDGFIPGGAEVGKDEALYWRFGAIREI
jgi:hypothetical protein